MKKEKTKAKRLELIFKNKGKGIIPLSYHDNVRGFFYKHLSGYNTKMHDGVSLFSLSGLMGWKFSEKPGILFVNDHIKLYVSVYKDDDYRFFLYNSRSNIGTHMAWDLFLDDVIEIEHDFCNVHETSFKCSPILLGLHRDKTYITYKDNPPLTSAVMKRIIKRKASQCSVSLSQDFELKFDYDHGYKLSNIDIKGTHNIASKCNITVKGTPEDIAFVHSVGVGLSTGCGFGFLYNKKELMKKSQNKVQYENE